MTYFFFNLYLMLSILARLSVCCLHGREHADPAYMGLSYIEEQIQLLRSRQASYSAQASGKIALTNVRVFDGYTIHNPSTVVINGDLISFDTDGIDMVIDGEGGIVLPGLIDSHCHVGSLKDVESLSTYGVTTGLNMNCQNYTLCHNLRNNTGLTSIFTSGVAAVKPNSTHAQLFHAPGNPLISSPDQAPQFVLNVFNNGSDYMKIVSESNGFNQATHNALVAATHALGKQSMTHAADLASYKVAIASKSNGLQHIPFDTPLTEDMAAQILAQNQYVTPTLNIGKVVSQSPELASFLSSGGQTLSYAAGEAGVKVLQRANVSILAGTDGISSIPGVDDPLGLTLHWELENLVAAGLSPAEALRAATMVPAKWHNLTGRGVIAEGMRADLILLKPGFNPLLNISMTQDIARVWNGGVEFVVSMNATNATGNTTSTTNTTMATEMPRSSATRSQSTHPLGFVGIALALMIGLVLYYDRMPYN
jgi:imidazolonepropionase-like amidohydrolase